MISNSIIYIYVMFFFYTSTKSFNKELYINVGQQTTMLWLKKKKNKYMCDIWYILGILYTLACLVIKYKEHKNLVVPKSLVVHKSNDLVFLQFFSSSLFVVCSTNKLRIHIYTIQSYTSNTQPFFSTNKFDLGRMKKKKTITTPELRSVS